MNFVRWFFKNKSDKLRVFQNIDSNTKNSTLYRRKTQEVIK